MCVLCIVRAKTCPCTCAASCYPRLAIRGERAQRRPESSPLLV